MFCCIAVVDGGKVSEVSDNVSYMYVYRSQNIQSTKTFNILSIHMIYTTCLYVHKIML